MKKNKMSLTTELDLTREGTAEMTRWCILIALHQSFGVGAARLNKILARAEKLGQESLDVAMTVNDRGMPSTDRSLALRRSWMPEGVDPDFRVPVLRSPRTRREEQLRMAGDVAASMVWTLCAEACIEELGFGAGRLNRLKEEALANYRQVNEEGHADGLDVAMEHLRRCAQDALKEDIMVDNQPDEDRVKQSERDYEEQKRVFLKRAVMQELGRRAGKGSLRVLSEKKLEEKATAAMAQLISDTAGVNEDELLDTAKDVVHITGRLDERGFMELETAPLPSNTIVYQQNRVAELKENSGNRDVNQGGATSGLTAASAIAALQEAGSKLSRDMLKSSYRSFAKECYFIIDLMRQFYDESRVYRITGQQGGTEYREFSGQMLRPQPVESVGGVELGAHEPVFDITVSAAKKSTFSRLSQNETAKECYQLGFFAPANADAALACLDMMDFEGIEKVRQRVAQNGTLYQQLQQAMAQIQQMAAVIDQQNGSNLSEQAGAAAAAMTGGGGGGEASAKTVTNSLGGQVGGGTNPLATKAAERAMNINNPNK